MKDFCQTKILVVDDEENIVEVVKFNLQKVGYSVLTAYSGEDALSFAQSNLPDLIVLDLMLPGIDGLEVCRILKADPKTRKIRILMLSARGEETDIVVGLEIGADDYLPKPFSPRVLLARVKAVLRRNIEDDETTPYGAQTYGKIKIHPGRHEVTVADEAIGLTATEFQLLEFLIRRPGWVFTRAQIVDAVRGVDYPVTDRSVDVHIASLRKKLGDQGHYIETVRGIGYRMRELA